MEKDNRQVLTEEQKKLIEDNLPFCYYWFNLHQIYSEDKQQSLLLALCKYIHLYDSERGAITTFIGTVFTSRFKSMYKEEHTDKRRLNEESFYLDDTLYSTDEGEEVTLASITPVIERGFDSVEAKMLVDNIIKNVQEDATISEQKVKMFLTYVETRNYSFCGKLYNLSAQAAEQSIKSTFKIIRNHHLDWNIMDVRYKKYTYPEIKKRFFELNNTNAPAEKAVIVVAKHAMKNKTKESRSFVISSDHPYFSKYGNEITLGATKYKALTDKRYAIHKWIKDEINDVEVCYIV